MNDPDSPTIKTVDDVRALVAELATNHDPELAHMEEDNIHEAVLQAVADGTLTGDEAREACRIALSTSNFDFSRWYA